MEKETLFETLEKHFDDEEKYRIVNVKPAMDFGAGPGAHIYVEPGETAPTLLNERDYWEERWVTEGTYRSTIWPTNDYTEVYGTKTGAGSGILSVQLPP